MIVWTLVSIFVFFGTIKKLFVLAKNGPEGKKCFQPKNVKKRTKLKKKKKNRYICFDNCVNPQRFYIGYFYQGTVESNFPQNGGYFD